MSGRGGFLIVFVSPPWDTQQLGLRVTFEFPGRRAGFETRTKETNSGAPGGVSSRILRRSENSTILPRISGLTPPGSPA